MLDKEKLQAKLNQRYRNLLKDVRFHEEGLKFDFAEEVCRVMEEKGISRAELARRMGTSPAWITKMLRTSWNMTMETIGKLAFALGMRVEPKLVPIKELSSELEYHGEQCWKDTPQGYTQEPLEFPKEKPFDKAAFQPLIIEVDIGNMPNFEDALVA